MERHVFRGSFDPKKQRVHYKLHAFRSQKYPTTSKDKSDSTEYEDDGSTVDEVEAGDNLRDRSQFRYTIDHLQNSDLAPSKFLVCTHSFALIVSLAANDRT